MPYAQRYGGGAPETFVTDDASDSGLTFTCSLVSIILAAAWPLI